MTRLLLFEEPLDLYSTLYLVIICTACLGAAICYRLCHKYVSKSTQELSRRNTVPGPLACIPNQKPELPAELPPTIAVSYPSGPEDDIDIGEEFSTTQEQQIESQPCTFGSPSGPKWIPCLSLRPPSSSVHGRKGSACIAWKEEDTEDDTGIFTFSHERPSTLLSGVGDQFVIGLGRRPSWLMWNDGNFNRSDGMETQRCSMA